MIVVIPKTKGDDLYEWVSIDAKNLMARKHHVLFNGVSTRMKIILVIEEIERLVKSKKIIFGIENDTLVYAAVIYVVEG